MARRRSRVRRRAVHPDAVQAGVFRLPPVGRHPEFHELEGTFTLLLSKKTKTKTTSSEPLSCFNATTALHSRRRRRRSGRRPRLGRRCRPPADVPPSGPRNPNPESTNPPSERRGGGRRGSTSTHVNAEVPGGAVHRPARRQSSGRVLHGDGRGEDGHGEADHQEARGASEGPAVPRVDVRLEVGKRQTSSRRREKGRSGSGESSTWMTARGDWE